MSGNEIGSKEIEHMEQQLEGMEARLQQQYCETGKAVLEIADNEQKEINSIVDEMIRLRRRIAEAKGDVQCADCMAYNDAGSKYCNRCGSRLEAEGGYI